MLLVMGERLRLRAMEPEDWELLYRWENDTRNWTVSQTLAPYSKYQLQQFIQNSSNNLFVDKQLRLMVVEKQTGTTVGILDLFRADIMHQRAEVGILIDEPFRGRGYGLETLVMAKTYARHVLKLHQLHCDIMASNTVSLRLFQRAGFSVVGIKKDWLQQKDGYEDVYLLQCLLPADSSA